MVSSGYSRKREIARSKPMTGAVKCNIGAPMAQEAESWGLLEANKWRGDLDFKRVYIEPNCKLLHIF
jgi:hypothetical protein